MLPNMIKKCDLKHGAYYEGRCRNASIARWDAENGYFIHWRTKFNDTFLEAIPHYDDAPVWQDFFLATKEMTDILRIDEVIPL